MSTDTFVFRCPLCTGQVSCHSRQHGERLRCPCCLRMVTIPVGPETGTTDQLPPDGAAGWQLDCQTAVVRLANLIIATKRRFDAASMIETLRQLPQSRDDKNASLDSLLNRCVVDLSTDREMAGEFEEFRRFVLRIAAMPPHRREMLEASVVGVITGLSMVQP